MVARDEIAQVAQRVGDDVEDGAIGGDRNVLIEPGDAEAWLGPHGAGVRRLLAADDPQERRLSGSVPADHADAFASLDPQVRFAEQRQVAECYRDLVEGNERHRLRLRRIVAQEIVGSGQHFGPIACREQLQEPVDGFPGHALFQHRRDARHELLEGTGRHSDVEAVNPASAVRGKDRSPG